MQNDALPVIIKAVLPTPEGCGVFLGLKQEKEKEKSGGKVFVIYIDPALGQILALSLSTVRKDRPLTHDLMTNIFKGLGVTVERMVIHHALGGTFYARLILKMENELGVKLIEVDSRPSDAMVLCLNAQKPISVATRLWDKVPDASALMNKLLAQ